MPSDDRRPVAGAVFSKREAILLAATAMTVTATLTVLLSRLTLDDAYITFRYARHLAEGYGLGAWNRTGEHVEGFLVIAADAAAPRRRRWLGASCSAGVEGVAPRRRLSSLPRSSGAATIARVLCGSLFRGVCAVLLRRVRYGPWRSPARHFALPVRPRGSRSSRRSSRCGPRRSSRRSTCWRCPAARAPAMDRRDGDAGALTLA